MNSCGNFHFTNVCGCGPPKTGGRSPNLKALNLQRSTSKMEDCKGKQGLDGKD